MIQRLEGLRQQSKSSLSFKEFVLENSMNHSSSEFSYLSELSWRAVDHIDMDSFDIASKYKDLLKVSDLDEVTGKRLKQLIYQLEVKKVDPKSIDMDALLKDCKQPSIFDDFRKMQADDVAELLVRNVDNSGSRFRLKGCAVIITPSDLGIDTWLLKQKAMVVKALRNNPDLGNIIGNGGTYIFTALDLVDFADVCGDIYLGIKYNTMTEKEAGERLFSWGCATLLSEAGAEAGAAIGAAIGSLCAPPLGTIAGGLIGGLLGGTVGYVLGNWFGETFYDDIYSSGFNFWDSVLSDGNHFLEGSSGNDYIFGGRGDDIIYGGNDADVIYGEADNDTIYGNDGDDFIDGGSGNNFIEGGKGADTIVSGSGDNTIYGDEESGTSSWYYGNDTIVVEAGTNYIVGGSYDDYISGGSGNDTIFGDNDNGYSDYLDGDDVLFGGAGNDRRYFFQDN